MSTTVIHVRDIDPSQGDVYIGRPAPRRRLAGSRWSNPYRITPDQPRRAHCGRGRGGGRVIDAVLYVTAHLVVCVTAGFVGARLARWVDERAREHQQAAREGE